MTEQQPILWQTENASLAYILDELGEEIGIQNIYDAERLREIGCHTITDALEKARRSNQPWKYAGRRIYSFRQTERLQRLLRAFDDGSKRAADGQPFEAEVTDAEGAAFLYGYFCASEKRFARRWMDRTPQYFEGKRGDVSETRIPHPAGGTKEIRKTFPGFKLVPVGLTEEQRRHVGL